MKRHFSLGRAEIWLLAIFRCFFDAFSPHFKKSPKLFSNNKISNQGWIHIVKGWNFNVQRKHLDQIQKFARYSHFNLGDFCDSTFINKKFLKSQSVASKTTLKCDLLKPTVSFFLLQLEMFYVNTIQKLFPFVEQLDQLEVWQPCNRLLTGIPILAVFQNLRWN